MSRRPVVTDEAPAAIGTYSQAVEVDGGSPATARAGMIPVP